MTIGCQRKVQYVKVWTELYTCAGMVHPRLFVPICTQLGLFHPKGWDTLMRIQKTRTWAQFLPRNVLCL